MQRRVSSNGRAMYQTGRGNVVKVEKRSHRAEVFPDLLKQMIELS